MWRNELVRISRAARTLSSLHAHFLDHHFIRIRVVRLSRDEIVIKKRRKQCARNNGEAQHRIAADVCVYVFYANFALALR